MNIPKFYIPSFYGDIKLEPVVGDEKVTRLIVEKATQREKVALASFAAYAVKKKWLDGGQGERVGGALDGGFDVKAPLLKVQAELTKLLKPGRVMVAAVKFTDGRMEEITSTDVEASGYTSAGPESAPVAVAAKPAAAVAVAKPTQGCPAPAFEHAELKAREVLEVFLDEDQLADFRAYNRFISVGAETGHRYMVTSRNDPRGLKKYQRSLYDLNDDMPFCVHDWVVPAAEEMLAIHLMLALPQHEYYLRHLEH